jgi:hypothetical protein
LDRLRFVTFLAQSLPVALFELVAKLVGERLGVATSVAADRRRIRRPRTDRRRPAPAPTRVSCARRLFDDPRANGAPVYFSDVIVAARSSAREFADLRGGVWAYNDVCSLSGFHCLLRRLDPFGGGRRFFAATRASGAHRVSIEWVAGGEADAAAIDSNGLRLALAAAPTAEQALAVLA